MRLGLAGPYAFVVRESSVGRFCVRYALAFFVPFLFYTVFFLYINIEKTRYKKKHTMQNRLTYKKRKYKKKHHTHTHKLSVQKHPRLGSAGEAARRTSPG